MIKSSGFVPADITRIRSDVIEDRSDMTSDCERGPFSGSDRAYTR